MNEIGPTEDPTSARYRANASGSALARRSGEVYVELLRASQFTEDCEAQDAMTAAIGLIAEYWSHREASDLRVAMEGIHDGLLSLLNEVLRLRVDDA